MILAAILTFVPSPIVPPDMISISPACSRSRMMGLAFSIGRLTEFELRARPKLSRSRDFVRT